MHYFLNIYKFYAFSACICMLYTVRFIQKLSAVGTGLTAQFRHGTAFVFLFIFFSRPPGAEGLFLGLRQLFEGDLPPEGGGLVRTRFQVGKA